ncbi:MAG: response regulator [Bacteriovorax sp.]|nr:response regulator [Bacteriovorax sp.]
MSVNETSILIVEDDLEILSILKNIFTKHFNIIHTATNGNSAQEIVRKSNPDLVLTDIQMPELNGIEFITQLRAEGKNTPVVIMSSGKERSDLMKAIKLGVLDFVEKPFKRADIEQAVHRVLEMTVRSNDLTNLIFIFGLESKEVKQQKKLIGLLQAISAQTNL